MSQMGIGWVDDLFDQFDLGEFFIRSQTYMKNRMLSDKTQYYYL